MTANEKTLLHRNTRRRWMLGCGGLLGLTAAGCGRGKDRVYSRGSTVTVAYCCGREALSPLQDLSAMFLVFSPLVAYDRELREDVPRLAQRCEHSPDFREWTYYLRPGVKWHDGAPVTAHDVKFGLDLLTHPAVMYFGPDEVESVAVLDDSTVRVRMGNLIHDEMGCLPKHLLADLDPHKIGDWEFWTRPVGNGPYRFVRYVPETMMEFRANPDYFRGKPRIERVVLKFAGEAGLTELLSGGVDALPDANPAHIPKLAVDPRFRVYHNPSSYGSGIYWHCAHPLFRDPRVRRALTLAINRRELLQVLNLPDNLPILDGVFTPAQVRRGELPEPLPYDPAGARALLDEAGWRDRGGVREREGKLFRFAAIVAARPGFDQLAVYVQDQFRRVGVRMEIQVLDKGVVDERMKAGQFEAALTLFAARFLARYFGKDAPAGYRSPELVKLLDQMIGTPDPNSTDHIYRALTEILRADLPVTSLVPRTGTFFVHRRIQGLSSPGRADPVRFMEDLWLEDGSQQ